MEEKVGGIADSILEKARAKVVGPESQLDAHIAKLEEVRRYLSFWETEEKTNSDGYPSEYFSRRLERAGEIGEKAKEEIAELQRQKEKLLEAFRACEEQIPALRRALAHKFHDDAFQKLEGEILELAAESDLVVARICGEIRGHLISLQRAVEVINNHALPSLGPAEKMVEEIEDQVDRNLGREISLAQTVRAISPVS